MCVAARPLGVARGSCLAPSRSLPLVWTPPSRSPRPPCAPPAHRRLCAPPYTPRLPSHQCPQRKLLLGRPCPRCVRSMLPWTMGQCRPPPFNGSGTSKSTLIQLPLPSLRFVALSHRLAPLGSYQMFLHMCSMMRSAHCLR
jgi:hypothetical protein